MNKNTQVSEDQKRYPQVSVYTFSAVANTRPVCSANLLVQRTIKYALRAIRNRKKKYTSNSSSTLPEFKPREYSSPRTEMHFRDEKQQMKIRKNDQTE